MKFLILLGTSLVLMAEVVFSTNLAGQDYQVIF